LGPFVVSLKDGKRSIIDGQQRLTSLTLFLIYLNNLQKELEQAEKIESMIFSELRGNKSFNITVEERIPCLEALFNNGEYSPNEDDDD
ncbi:GmrSD restriction endonuclease domain-containing protein, partial [Neisseria sp. P0014.S004]|uniref:GmrSD restriction endonuclease domain-containing protein n=1 Tax=Neisseria sp. P0014.S004 TaxID=3436750 RepID=UPI003F7FBB7A